ncbi:MAG TPA: orotate phosphoribosyltransferase [Candidatus Limnocylindrales bacterium]|nr:orotate phosphoribosyltransferase [Candidatus Limnocylindrales bacterium]
MMSGALGPVEEWLAIQNGSDAVRRELARDIRDACLLHGDFVLSSGVRSNYYLDKYLFETRPSILRRVARYLAAYIPPECDRIAGPALGAVAIATAVSLETGLPFVIVKGEAKSYGTAHLIEGELHPGEAVVLLEDVVTSGTQALRAAGKLQALGARVLSILAVVDREQGGAEAMSAAGVHYEALFTRADLEG